MSRKVLPSFGGGGGGFCRRCLAALLQRGFARRHAHLVVAGAPLQVGVDVVLGLRELHLLYKLHRLLEVAQVHAEHLVELRDFLTPRRQLAHQFGTLQLVDVQRCLDGAVLSQIGRIDVPARIDGSRENHLGLGARARLQLCGEFHGVLHLCHGVQRQHQQQGQQRKMLFCFHVDIV